MFIIKEITIDGFGCFTQRLVIQKCYPCVNQIVGVRAGDGVNVLAAIEFVFTGENSRLAPTLKNFYRHHHNPRITKGHVEIVLTIIDKHRLPIPGKEVRLVRTITERLSMLEMDGRPITFDQLTRFFMDNGYVIPFPNYLMLNQNTLANMATQTEPERLRMFMAFTGSTTFQIDNTSLRQLFKIHNSELDAFAKKIETYGGYKARLQTCLNRYHDAVELKIKKSSLEYYLNKKECEVIQMQLKKLEFKYKQTVDLLTLFETEVTSTGNYERALNKSKAEVETMRSILTTVDDLIRKRTESRDALESKIQDSLKTLSGPRPKSHKSMPQITRLSRQISDINSELKIVNEKIAKTVIEHNLSELKTPDEREEYLEKAKIFQSSVDAPDSSNAMMKRFLSQARIILDEAVGTMEKRRQEACEKLACQKQRIMEQALKKEKLQQAEVQKAGHRMKELHQSYIAEKEQFEKAKKLYEQSTPTDIKIANQTIAIIFEKIGSEGTELDVNFYGMLIDIFHCPVGLAPVIDMLAADTLYRFVVQTSRVAIKLLDFQQQFQLPGHLRFLVLDQFEDTDIPYPEEYCVGADMVPLMHILGYTTTFKPLINGILGNVIICQNGDQVEPPCELIGTYKFLMQENAIWDLDGRIVIGILDREAPIVKASRCREHYYKCEDMKALCDAQNERYEKEVAAQKKILTLIESVKEDYERIKSEKGDYLVNLDIHKDTINLLKTFRRPFDDTLKKHCLHVEAFGERLKKVPNYFESSCVSAMSLLTKFQKLLKKTRFAPEPSATNSADNDVYAVICMRRKKIQEYIRKLRVRRDELIREARSDTLKEESSDVQAMIYEIGLLDMDIACFMDVAAYLRHIFNGVIDTEKLLFAHLRHHQSILNLLQNSLKAVNAAVVDFTEVYDKLALDLDEKMLANSDFTFDDTFLNFDCMDMQKIKAELVTITQTLRNYADPYLNKSINEFRYVSQQMQLFKDSAEMIKLRMVFKHLLERIESQDLTIFRSHFKTFAEGLQENFKRLAPRGDIHIYLNESTRINAGNSIWSYYSGIGLHVSFHEKHRILFRTRMLTFEQRLLTGLAILCTMISKGEAPFVLLENVDRFISERNMPTIAQMILELSERTQFFIVSRHSHVMVAAGCYISIHWHGDLMCIASINYTEILSLLQVIRRTRASGCIDYDPFCTSYDMLEGVCYLQHL